MTETLKVNLAVPGRSLLKADGSGLEVFGTSWDHLNHYIELLRVLPDNLGGCSPATRDAVARLRLQARAFGNPGDGADPRDTSTSVYAGVTRLVDALRQSADSVLKVLHELQGDAGSAKLALDCFETLGGSAAAPIAAAEELIPAVKDMKAWIVRANEDLKSSFASDSDELRRLNEDVGGLGAKVAQLQTRLSELGTFSKRSTREQLEQELQAAQSEYEVKTGEANCLREALSRVEPLVTEGYWLAQGLTDIIRFAEEVRTVWTRLETNAGQLMTTATSAPLQDPARVMTALGVEEAIGQWTAIRDAADAFLRPLSRNTEAQRQGA